MSKKKNKDPRGKPKPRPNQQIPNSMIRPLSVVGVNPVLEQARDFPIYGCWIMAGWQEVGMTPVIVARQQDDTHIMFASYMVDIFCLGIKDAFTRADYTLNRFERDLPEILRHAPEKISVELAHEVVYGALEYAEKLGFQPHPDFKNQKADLMLDLPGTHPRSGDVEFGKNGQPFFIPSPYDNQLKVQSVISTLTRTVGQGNFKVLMIS